MSRKRGVSLKIESMSSSPEKMRQSEEKEAKLEKASSQSR